MQKELRIAIAAATFLLLALASWGLVGSILYCYKQDTLERIVVQQQQQIQQWGMLAQAKHDTLQALRQSK